MQCGVCIAVGYDVQSSHGKVRKGMAATEGRVDRAGKTHLQCGGLGPLAQQASCEGRAVSTKPPPTNKRTTKSTAYQPNHQQTPR